MVPILTPPPRPVHPQRLEGLTERTRALLPAHVLDDRIGAGLHTVASALDRQVRFRVEHPGRGDQRVVPDSRLAHELMDTAAGPRLVRMLDVAARQTHITDARRNMLRGFVLPEDDAGIAASMVLSTLDSNRAGARAEARQLLDPAAEREQWLLMTTYSESAMEHAKFANAFHREGWITFGPDVARVLMTASGAYTPEPGEAAADADASVGRVVGTTVHEVQHAITPRPPKSGGSFSKSGWVEEGLANVLAYPEPVQRRTQAAMGVDAAQYAARLAQGADSDIGWSHWQAPEEEMSAVQAQQLQRNYLSSESALQVLLDMGGADLATDAGLARARSILQDKSAPYVPGRIADAIIAHNELDPRVRERLRGRIQGVLDDERGLAGIAADFGVGSRLLQSR